MRSIEKRAEDLRDTYYFILYELQSNPIPKELMIQAKKCAIIDVQNTLRALDMVEGQYTSLYEEEQFYLEILKYIKKL